jgi:hypothetical protein
LAKRKWGFETYLTVLNHKHIAFYSEKRTRKKIVINELEFKEICVTLPDP